MRAGIVSAAGDEFGLSVAARARGQVANMHGWMDGLTAAYDDDRELHTDADEGQVFHGRVHRARELRQAGGVVRLDGRGGKRYSKCSCCQ